MLPCSPRQMGVVRISAAAVRMSGQNQAAGRFPKAGAMSTHRFPPEIKDFKNNTPVTFLHGIRQEGQILAIQTARIIPDGTLVKSFDRTLNPTGLPRTSKDMNGLDIPLRAT